MATYGNPPGTISERLNDIRRELGNPSTDQHRDVQQSLQKLFAGLHRLIDLVEESSETHQPETPASTE